MSLKRGATPFPVQIKDIVPLELKAVWEAMEECQRRGLTRSIGVSNFTTKKLEELLQYAKIPPAVNQVEMNPVWQQKKLREFCMKKSIHVTAYSPIGGQDSFLSSKNLVRDSEVLEGIAKAKGKTVAQVSLRWVHEQGVSMVVKSFNEERLKENLEIFDWELSQEDIYKISQIPQCKRISITGVLSLIPSESLETIDLSDVDVVE
ncbi:non-functional NADPH-dependent codeinone reductase 2 [Canna indica]|uniref:Non-functional NADPH-dependent codeinone reductase 2 n=1 Tax=Canna indica TaxID=4628 RepID=A0AAQ3K9V7_9LILI|nr:non-functional NADPH-dependent codeinone reductase 2 [Canna indica]